jgi:hypothetical protein
MAIVDRLEVVEIEKNKRRARAVTLDVSERALEFSLRRLSVSVSGSTSIRASIAPIRAREASSSPASRSTSAASSIASARRRGFVVFGSSTPPRLFIGWRSEADRRGRGASGVFGDRAGCRFTGPASNRERSLAQRRLRRIDAAR